MISPPSLWRSRTRPVTTRSFRWLLWRAQWAAVRTFAGAITEPVQIRLLCSRIATTKGQSAIDARWPPTTAEEDWGRRRAVRAHPRTTADARRFIDPDLGSVNGPRGRGPCA